MSEHACNEQMPTFQNGMKMFFINYSLSNAPKSIKEDVSFGGTGINTNNYVTFVPQHFVVCRF
jgi:hypothetical protein